MFSREVVFAALKDGAEYGAAFGLADLAVTYAQKEQYLERTDDAWRKVTLLRAAGAGVLLVLFMWVDPDMMASFPVWPEIYPITSIVIGAFGAFTVACPLGIIASRIDPNKYSDSKKSSQQ